MRTLRFSKMQGVGNDFVLVDGRELPGIDWSGLAIEICDRHLGVGADGLLVIDSSHIADATMRMYNPDGTPDVCGNGLRCVARFLHDRFPPTHRTNDPMTLTIATLSGVRRAEIRPDGPVSVEMGEPRFAPAEIPMSVPGPKVVDYPLEVGGEIVQLTALSTGSTHSVIFVEDLPGDDRFLTLSPLIENHSIFPDRTSVMWTVVESRERLRLRIWERGVGETLGCGTGACAAAVAARIHGLTEQTVAVLSGGGELSVGWREGDPIQLTGPAEYVFEGIYPLEAPA